eukprot:SAG25_NODE_347_length_9358_cov_86.358315_4_plen_103_part_00
MMIIIISLYHYLPPPPNLVLYRSFTSPRCAHRRISVTSDDDCFHYLPLPPNLVLGDLCHSFTSPRCAQGGFLAVSVGCMLALWALPLRVHTEVLPRLIVGSD